MYLPTPVSVIIFFPLCSSRASEYRSALVAVFSNLGVGKLDVESPMVSGVSPFNAHSSSGDSL